MNIYKISCCSRCGSYFGAYLQSLTILAVSEEQAIKIAKDYQSSDMDFIYPENQWDIEILSTNVHESGVGVIDSLFDSDY